jgi:REP element-mobilizing transposase RayT
MSLKTLLLMNGKRNVYMEYWRKSIRLEGWDYRNPWYYFITICTKDRRHYFGEIRNGMMGLTEQGCAAWYFWNEIPNHFDFVKLDEFVVMPDHVHGIIQIIPDENGNHSVGKRYAASLRIKREFGKPISKSLSTIIRSYKSAMTRWCNQNNYEFAWQSRFYDHIIRNYRALDDIREYIKMNPKKWESD